VPHQHNQSLDQEAAGVRTRGARAAGKRAQLHKYARSCRQQWQKVGATELKEQEGQQASRGCVAGRMDGGQLHQQVNQKRLLGRAVAVNFWGAGAGVRYRELLRPFFQSAVGVCTIMPILTFAV
jgi:hypothetical protein